MIEEDMTMHGFREAYISAKLDPLAQSHVDFPYEEVIRRLDKEPEPVNRRAELATELRRLIVWALGDAANRRGKVHLRGVARRTIALAWLMSPSNFELSPSLRDLAKRFDFSAAHLSQAAADCTRTFGIRNRGQCHGDHCRGKAVSQDGQGATGTQEAGQHTGSVGDVATGQARAKAGLYNKESFIPENPSRAGHIPPPA
jgi:hypothetical protein